MFSAVPHDSIAFTLFNSSIRFVLDSGCSSHMCSSKLIFDNLTQLSKPTIIEVADGNTIESTEKGSVGILKDVYHVPELKQNLISISAFDKEGYGILFEGGQVHMRRSKNDEFQLVGVLDGSLYESTPDFVQSGYGTPTETAGIVVQHVSDFDLWHQRLAHLGYDNVRHMYNKKVVSGMHIRDGSEKKTHECDACAVAKATRKIPKSSLSSYRKQPGKPRKKKKLDIDMYFKEVNSDLIGPMSVQGIDGTRYAIHFTEAKSRHRWLYTMKHKSETLDKIKEFVSEIESLGFKLKLLKTDNGGEYVNDEVNTYARGKFTLRTTPPHTPESNATAERFNRVLGERTRAMLKDKQLPLFLWPEAMKTVTYLSNRTTTVAVGNKLLTPYEILFDSKPDISHLRVFGCKAFAYNFDITRKKLDDKAKSGILVGYDLTSSAYRVYLHQQRKVIKSGHVVFHERSQSSWGELLQPALDSDWDLGIDDDDDHHHDDEHPAHVVPDPTTTEFQIQVQELLDEARAATAPLPPVPENAPMATRGIKRDYKAMHNGTHRAGGERVYSVRETILHALKDSKDLEEPSNFTEANQSEQQEEWQQAINSELLSIWSNNVWHKEDLPEGVKPLTTKWVFKIKRGEHGQILKFKARLCVRGFEQEQGIDFEEVFSPVMRHNSLRTLLSLAAVHDYEIKQMDVATAFLHGELQEDVYIWAPEGTGFEPGTALKLDKSIYGLKQAPRVFNTSLNKHIVECMGFKQCITDPCVYIKETESGPIYLAVYVDDMLIVGKNINEVNKVKVDLAKEFKMDDRGDVEYILGIQVIRDRDARTLEIKQTQYAKDVVKRFRMENSKCKLKVPIHPKTKFSNDDCPSTQDDIEYMKKVPYRSAIGSLMYLATCTRPDISYAVSMCASFMHNPGKTHWDAVKNILAYINATQDRGITYGSRECSDELLNVVYAYVDADHAGDLDNRRSRTGYVMMLHGGAVSWKTRLQDRTSMSSTEAEYYAASEGFGEAKWFRMLLAELELMPTKPTVILEDNKSCINLSENPVYQYRTKQIETRHHQLREAVRFKEIVLEHISTEFQGADSLTKGLEWIKFQFLTNMIMNEVIMVDTV